MSTLVGLLAGSVSILLTWIAIGALLAGIGVPVLARFGARRPGVEGWLDGAWMGLVIVVLVLQVWHTFLPIGAIPTLALGLAGVIGLAGHARGLGASLRRGWSDRGRRWAGVAFLIAALWAANQLTGPPTQYDTGMYHAPMVRWIRSFPLVPGLGNLHGRLAFNNANLLFAALIDGTVWRGGATHVVNGVLIFLLLAQVSAALAGLVSARAGGPRGRLVFDGLLLAPVLAKVIHEDARSHSPDLAVAVVLLAAASRLYALLVERDGRSRGGEVALVVALFALAVCFKLSAAAFAGIGTVIALSLGSAPGRDGPGRLRFAASTLVLPALLVGPWLARGAVLSGYPLYPIRAVAVAADWRVPGEQADAELAYIRHSARWVDNEPGEGWDWVGPWLRTMTNPYRRVRILLPLVLAAAGSLLWLLRAGAGRGAARPPTGGLLLVPTAAGMAFWFVTAPHPRFGYFLFWVAAATVVAELVGRAPRTVPRPGRRIALALLFLGSLPLLDDPLMQFVRHGRNPARTLVDRMIRAPGPDRGLHPMPEAELTTFRTESGLRLWTPVSSNHCWDTPALPCTPHPARNLELRRAGDLRHGFRIDGSWRPESWPNRHSAFLEEWRQGRSRSTTTPSSDSPTR
ncbi:MAG: LIC_10190 family membrane protein [Gemmatimonadota bacterium]